MAAQLNHTLVAAHDPAASARFLAEMFDLPEPYPYGPFERDRGQVLEALTVPYGGWSDRMSGTGEN